MKNNDLNTELMRVAWLIAERSNCIRQKVGAVVVREETVVITAVNGTPEGIKPCNEGGCRRCSSDAPRGEMYESCLCIHAEQGAIALAARNSIITDGAIMYCTLRPCLTCVKLCWEAGITRIIYDEEISFAGDVEEAYTQFIQQTGAEIGKMHRHEEYQEESGTESGLLSKEE